ncbi:MAG: hypothetical protein ACXQTN_04415 [Methanoculleaceae archaeon]
METFTAAREDSPGSAFSHYVVLLIIFAVLNAVVLFALMRLAGQQTVLVLVPVVPVVALVWLVGGAILFGIVGAIIAGAVLHIFVHVAGGRKGVSQTIKALAYAATRYHRSISSAPSGALFYRYSPSGSYMRSQPSGRFLRLYFRCSLCPPDDRWNEHDLDGWNALKIPVTTSFFFSCHQRPGSIDSNPCPFAFIRHPFITPSA